MKSKLILYLSPFLFSLLISSNPMRSEGNICRYSDWIEYEKCHSENKFNPSPKYPVIIGDHKKYGLFKICLKDNPKCLKIKNKYKNPIIGLKANDEKQLNILIGKTGFTKWGDYKVSIEIPYTNIIMWSKKEILNNYKMGLYSISYLDKSFKKQSIHFTTIIDQSIIWPRPKKGDIISNFLRNISRLKENEENDLSHTLNVLEKRIDIIKSIIKIPNSTRDSCLETNKDKYPELVGEYNELIQSLNPLRAKVNFPPRKNIQSICADS